MQRMLREANENSQAGNCDAELNGRKKRKLARKLYSDNKKGIINNEEIGTLSIFDKDVCDCLVENCPGCHFPCPKCRSCKCALDCRVNRKWLYETIESETGI